MKKRMSRILSALLVSALVMSAGNVVQAEDGGASSTGKAKVEAEAIPQSQGTNVLGTMSDSSSVKEITTKATVSGSIPLNKVVTGAEKNVDIGAIAWANTSDYRKGKDYYYGYSQQVSLAKGTLELAVGGQGTERVYYGLYKDAGLTQAVDSYSWADPGKITDRMFKVPAKGTYYLGVYSTVYSSTPEGTVIMGAAVGARFFNGSDRTLGIGKQIAVGQKDAQSNYFKFKAAQNGVIKAYGSKYATGYSVALYNSKKKALSGWTPLKYNPTYGVKKGQTYYIRVKSSRNSYGYYNFKITNPAVKEKSGKNKAKAVTVKKGKTVKGTILAGNGQADWYKFKKTNKKTTKITIKGQTNGTFRVRLYRGGKQVSAKTFNYRYGGYEFRLYNYPKGTYYVKVERANAKSSGYYALAWK